MKPFFNFQFLRIFWICINQNGNYCFKNCLMLFSKSYLLSQCCMNLQAWKLALLLHIFCHLTPWQLFASVRILHYIEWRGPTVDCDSWYIYTLYIIHILCIWNYVENGRNSITRTTKMAINIASKTVCSFLTYFHALYNFVE